MNNLWDILMTAINKAIGRILVWSGASATSIETWKKGVEEKNESIILMDRELNRKLPIIRIGVWAIVIFVALFLVDRFLKYRR